MTCVQLHWKSDEDELTFDILISFDSRLSRYYSDAQIDYQLNMLDVHPRQAARYITHTDVSLWNFQKLISAVEDAPARQIHSLVIMKPVDDVEEAPRSW